jgi:acetyl-CoA acetyltransferase
MLAGINAGMFDIGVIVNGQAGYSRRNFPRGSVGGQGGDPIGPDAQFVNPYGTTGAPSQYSHAMTRHMHQWGTTKEDFAEIAVSTRKWAGLNPRAIMHSKETNPNGGPISVEDVLNSRIISWPLNLLDVCLVTDHGGAVLVASEAAARSFRTPPVWIAGAGEAIGHATMLEMKDFTATSAAASGARAYKMANMGPEDMEMAMIYDSFTITVAITMEMLGLTKRGEGPSLFKEGRTEPGGEFPVNTNGGGLSFNHSGMYGMQLLVEAYRQLSRTAEDGIHGLPGKQTDATSCVVNGTGGTLSATGTLVLVSD